MNRRFTPAVLAAIFAGIIHPACAQNPIPPSPRITSGKSTPVPSETPIVSGLVTGGGVPSTAVSTTSTATAAVSGDYVLAPSDTIEMTVFHEADLTTQTRISNDGSVQFPLIGEMKIGGLTVRNAREMIRKRYNADYLVEPQVYLNVLAYAQRKFTLLGQVAQPGTFAFPGGESLDLLQAVGMAGGFTRLADRGKIIVKRSDHGHEETLKVNAKATKDGKSFELKPGDVVTVNETWL